MAGYPKSTYQNIPNPGQPRYTEAWALIESARRMAEVIKDGIPEDIKDRNVLRDALRLNWRLWTIFQAELSITEDDTIPLEVRQNMLTLCKFVDQHTVEVLSNPTPESIVTLIDINRNIASGLLELSEEDVAAEAASGDAAPADSGPYQPKGPQPAAPSPASPNDNGDEPAPFNFDEEI